ncbi:cytochrome P450 71A8 [Lactuca sativa]|uniref:cytochrome P450 71A8 n=1 Tax=Lactuca sativa TaxID=4236 RepID=UPI000CD81CAD|nr:cytochrome P450 71A8 [Lactuca sativa]
MPANLSDLFSSLTNDVTCMATFGRMYHEGGIGKKFKKIMQEFSEVLGSFYFEESIPQIVVVDHLRGLSDKFDRVVADFDEFLQGVVDETIAKVSNNPGQADVIKALPSDAYVAGTDTSSSVLEWAMSELLLHLDRLKKVQDEVRSILNGKEEITDEDLDNMTYLKVVIMETTRLHPLF